MYESNSGCHIANFMFFALLLHGNWIRFLPLAKNWHKIGRIFRPYKPQHKFKSKGLNPKLQKF